MQGGALAGAGVQPLEQLPVLRLRRHRPPLQQLHLACQRAHTRPHRHHLQLSLPHVQLGPPRGVARRLERMGALALRLVVDGRAAHQLLDPLGLRRAHLLNVRQIGAQRALRHLRRAYLRLQQQQTVLCLLPEALDAAHLDVDALAHVRATPERHHLAPQPLHLRLEGGQRAGATASRPAGVRADRLRERNRRFRRP